MVTLERIGRREGERVIIKGHNGTLKVMSMFAMLIEVIVSQVDVS